MSAADARLISFFITACAPDFPQRLASHRPYRTSAPKQRVVTTYGNDSSAGRKMHGVEC
jgi:hypothetical protein